jgi:hypothetical protein
MGHANNAKERPSEVGTITALKTAIGYSDRCTFAVKINNKQKKN